MYIEILHCATHKGLFPFTVESWHKGLCYMNWKERIKIYPWWRHQMEAFSALLAICAENSLVTGEFPAQRPVTRSFDLHLNKRLSKQSRGWWFEAQSRPLWRHCNAENNRLTYSCDGFVLRWRTIGGYIYRPRQHTSSYSIKSKLGIPFFRTATIVYLSAYKIRSVCYWCIWYEISINQNIRIITF